MTEGTKGAGPPREGAARRASRADSAERAQDTRSLLRREEAAQKLGISVRSVKRLIAAGELPLVYVGPERVSPRIRPADLDAYIERCAAAS